MPRRRSHCFLRRGSIPLLAAALLASAPAGARNLVVIVMDDLGVDLLGSYGEAGSPPPDEHLVTPRIQDLADEGLLFRNVWATPRCSATRATLITGQYGYRTGIGNAAPMLPAPSDPPRYAPLAAQLAASHGERAVVGKWHLTSYHPDALPFHWTGVSPTDLGFTEYRGAWNNLVDPEDYFDYVAATQVAPAAPGVAPQSDYYITTYEIDRAIDFVERPHAGDWLLWVGLHAIHTPLQVPPDDLHSQEDVKIDYDPGESPAPDDERRVMLAVLQAMDTEVGRLLDALDLSDTTVLLLGDNGTLSPLETAVNRGSKFEESIYEGGINVPLIVAGDAVSPAVYGTESAAMVHTVDVYATILELAGVPLPTNVPVDGVSFAPVLNAPALSPRTIAYTDGVFGCPGCGGSPPKEHDVAVRNARYKLIRFGCHEGLAYNRHEFYDLLADPGETTPLPNNGPAYASLSNAIPRASCTSGGGGGCGLGFEVALPLALLGWRRRARAGTEG